MGRRNRARRARTASAAPLAVKTPQTVSSYGRGPYAKVRVQMALQGWDPRSSGAQMLRNFSRRNEWVRIAIDRRKSTIAQAKWKLVRNDDPKKPADPRVVDRVRELLRYVNPKRESLRSLLDQSIEDLLVLDAGCIEKERTLGGEIAYLWAVDGGTIVPDPSWDGRDPSVPRYYQFIDGRPAMREEPPGSNNWVPVSVLNEDLIYMMRTPTTYSAIGWSYVETLVRCIEADLYGEQYDYEMLRQTAPAGVLDLGRGLTREQIEEAREYYESEIAGSKDVMVAGALYDPMSPAGNTGPSINFVPFGRSNRDMQRDFYKQWLVKKIALVFQMDPTVFGIVGDVNRATSKTLSVRTDEGHVSDAKLVQEFLSRELVWEIDENHSFEFDEITPRDESQQADIDVKYVNAGIWTANEVRVRQGLDEMEGGESLRSSPAAVDDAPASEEDPQEPDDPKTPDTQDDEEDNDKPEGGKSAVPFVAASVRTRTAKLGYLSISDR